MMNKRPHYVLRIMIGLLVLFGMCFPGVGSMEPASKLRVGVLSGVTGLAMLQMVSEQMKFDFPVSYEIFRSPEPVVGKLVTGEIDIAGLPTNTAAILYNKGVGLGLTSVIGWGVMYVVGRDAKVKLWKDLKGKEVYVASKGAVSDLLFQYLCLKNGLKPDQDLKIQYVANAAELAQLVGAGKVDFAAIPEPWVSAALDKNPDLKVLLDYQREWQRVEKLDATYPQTCMVIRRETAQTYPDEVKQFEAQIRKGIEWVNAGAEITGLMAEKYLQIPAAVLPKALNRLNLKYVDSRKASTDVDRFLQRLFSVAPEAVGGKIPDAKFYFEP